MLNKRGDIPVTLLVLGVVAICGLALLSFLKFGADTSDSFVGISETAKMSSYIEKYYFYRDVEGLNENEIKNKLGVDINKQESGSLYFEKKVEEGYLFWKKEKVIFSIKYVLP